MNALDNDKRTALHHAAEAGKAKAIEILVQNGAHTNIRDTLMKKTPIELACNNKIRQRILQSVPGYQPPSKEEPTLQAK